MDNVYQSEMREQKVTLWVSTFSNVKILTDYNFFFAETWKMHLLYLLYNTVEQRHFTAHNELLHCTLDDCINAYYGITLKIH